jgi:ADP-ribose pyrophosphatase YjhB (NUDIX family)
MVRQAGPGEELFWTIPGGRIEEGELATEGHGLDV